MKKIFLLSAALFCAVGSAWAEAVTAEMAKAAADQWVARNPEFKAGGKALSVLSVCDTNAAKTVLWHQVRMSGDGMLVVAPATEIEPVIAALDNDPGELPAAHPLRALLTRDMRKRLRFLGLYTEDAKSTPALMSVRPAASAGADGETEEDAERKAVATAWAARQEKKWAKLGVRTARGVQLMASGTVAVDDIAVEIGIVKGFEKGGALTHWNQSTGGGGKCYNYHTPNNYVCGCVATALSAILQFFNVAGAPDTPYASDRCYVDHVKTAKETIADPDGGTAYDWTILPVNYGGEAEESLTLDDKQRELLGRVAYNSGVAVSMDWSKGESSAFEFEIATALRDVFGFKDARAIRNLTSEHYGKVIYAQNQCGVPVALGIQGEGGGHSVLAVGYGRDADNVERVRIFCGWAGAGDAWYALPYVDTKSSESGGSYLFDVVDDAVTMIACGDENSVPVCGQLIPGLNAEVTVDGISGTANKNGYFGVRVTPGEDARTVSVECPSEGKRNSVEVPADPGVHADTVSCLLSGGSVVKIDCAYFGDAATLPVADNLILLLVNSESAASYSEAIKKGNDLKRPILFFSGTSGEYATEAAWRLIKELDETDGANDPYFAGCGGFTNKFVMAYFPFNAYDAVSDVNPSYGVFDPRAVTEANRWTWYNARLRYDDISEYALATNVVAATEDTPETTNVTAVATEPTTNAVMNVLTNGLELFSACVENIRVEITDESADGVSFRSRTLTETFRAGQTPGFTVPPVVYESATGLAWTNAGWVVSNVVQTADGAVTNELAAGGGTAADVPALEADGVYLLTWQWTNFAARVQTEIGSEGKGGTVDVTEDIWVPLGEDVVVTAHPDLTGTGTRYWTFGWWEIQPFGAEYACAVADYPAEFQASCETPFAGTCATEGTSVHLTVREPVSLIAYFDEVTDTSDPHELEMTAAPDELVDNLPSLLNLPPVKWGTEAIGYGTTTGYLDGPATFTLALTNLTNLGTNWVCTGWKAYTNEVAYAEGTGPRAWFDFVADTKLVWQWKVVESGELKPGQVPYAPGGLSPLVSAPGQITVQIANTVAGWWYGLYQSPTLAGGTWTCVRADQALADNELVSYVWDVDPSTGGTMFFKIILTETKPAIASDPD